MSRVCQITGKRAMVGNKISHSNRSVKRKFNVNLHKKRFYLPSEDRWVVLNVSAHGLRIINKIGVESAVKEAREKGFIVKI